MIATFSSCICCTEYMLPGTWYRYSVLPISSYPGTSLKRQRLFRRTHGRHKTHHSLKHGFIKNMNINICIYIYINVGERIATCGMFWSSTPACSILVPSASKVCRRRPPPLRPPLWITHRSLGNFQNTCHCEGSHPVMSHIRWK